MDGITDSMDVCLSELRELVMDRKAWRAVIHRFAKSWTQLSDFTFSGLIGFISEFHYPSYLTVKLPQSADSCVV